MVQTPVIATSDYEAIIKAIQECQRKDIPVVKAKITASADIDNGTSQKVYAVSTFTRKQLDPELRETM